VCSRLPWLETVATSGRDVRAMAVRARALRSSFSAAWSTTGGASWLCSSHKPPVVVPLLPRLSSKVGLAPKTTGLSAHGLAGVRSSSEERTVCRVGLDTGVEACSAEAMGGEYQRWGRACGKTARAKGVLFRGSPPAWALEFPLYFRSSTAAGLSLKSARVCFHQAEVGRSHRQLLVVVAGALEPLVRYSK
jgi:hypothetical protein